MAHILLTTIGSLGDLHPFLAVALELKRRGHRATIATSAVYREKIEAEGVDFHAIPPELDPTDKAVLSAVMDLKHGTQRVIREIAMPAVRGMYESLAAVMGKTDLVVASGLSYGAPLAAEKHGVRWMGAALAPIAFLSRHDMPVIPQAPWLRMMYGFGDGVNGVIVKLGKLTSRAWSEPVHALRKDLGLKPDSDPIFSGQFSPHGNLALFSRVLAEPQPDWPVLTTQTGFALFDSHDGVASLPPRLAAFLDGGEPPIVFTLGSAAVMSAGDFYGESVKAAAQLGRRAVLLTGKDTSNIDPKQLPKDMLAVDYAPHSLLFRRACAVVHQGGVGTTGQGLRAGKPTLIVPFSHDQPDNAARVERLGVSLTLTRKSYRASTAAAKLRQVLGDKSFAQSAARASEIVRRENGAAGAALAIEHTLSL